MASLLPRHLLHLHPQLLLRPLLQSRQRLRLHRLPHRDRLLLLLKLLLRHLRPAQHLYSLHFSQQNRCR